MWIIVNKILFKPTIPSKDRSLKSKAYNGSEWKKNTSVHIGYM